jgi:hypothetical protein
VLNSRLDARRSGAGPANMWPRRSVSMLYDALYHLRRAKRGNKCNASLSSPAVPRLSIDIRLIRATRPKLRARGLPQLEQFAL